jgi:hypothetical protein
VWLFAEEVGERLHTGVVDHNGQSRVTFGQFVGERVDRVRVREVDHVRRDPVTVFGGEGHQPLMVASGGHHVRAERVLNDRATMTSWRLRCRCERPAAVSCENRCS